MRRGGDCVIVTGAPFAACSTHRRGAADQSRTRPFAAAVLAAIVDAGGRA